MGEAVCRDNEPLISVIVPVYKVEQYLRKCVDSILAQTYRNLEIILVDDGSPDGCPTICDDYAKVNQRVKVIHKVNGGLSDARNAGLKIASGQWISFVDSDDIISNSMIERLLKVTFEVDDCNLVVCQFERFRDEKIFQNSVPITHCKSKLEIKSADRCLFTNVRGGMYVWGALYSCSIVQQYALKYDTSLIALEDVIWNLIYLEKVRSVYYIDEKLYFYRIHKDSLSNARKDKLTFARFWFSARKSFLSYLHRATITSNNIKFLRRAYRKIQNSLFGELFAQKASYQDYRKLLCECGIDAKETPRWLVDSKIESMFPALYFFTYYSLLKARNAFK